MRSARRILAFLLESCCQDHIFADRKVFGGIDLLLFTAEEVVHVMQAVVLDVQRMTTEPAAMRKKHTGRTWLGQIDNGPDRE